MSESFDILWSFCQSNQYYPPPADADSNDAGAGDGVCSRDICEDSHNGYGAVVMVSVAGMVAGMVAVATLVMMRPVLFMTVRLTTVIVIQLKNTFSLLPQKWQLDPKLQKRITKLSLFEIGLPTFWGQALPQRPVSVGRTGL